MFKSLLFSMLLSFPVLVSVQSHAESYYHNQPVIPKGNNQPVIPKGKLVYTEIVINAPVEKVWQVLTNFQDYPNWNPFLRSVTGPVEVGKKIKATFFLPPGSKGINFKPKVVHFEKNRELRWIGQLWLPYLLDGEHSFVLVDNGNQTTTFKHFERFRGLLLPFVKRKLENNTKKGYEQMNQKLKEQCERGEGYNLIE